MLVTLRRCMNVIVCVCMQYHLHIGVCVCLYVQMYMYVCKDVCMYVVCMYVCMYMYVCMSANGMKGTVTPLHLCSWGCWVVPV